MNILGLHGGFTINQHDPAAALICDGRLIAVVEEERLFRVKMSRGVLPIGSIVAVLREGRLKIEDIDLIAHPGETYDDMPARVQAYFKHHFGHSPPVVPVNHQMAHLASAFYPSGFERAMCLSYDSHGDQLSGAFGSATRGGGIKMTETRPGGNSLGMFYATMTSFLGFQPGEDEYKVMGLAPYGEEDVDLSFFSRPSDDGYFVDHSFVRQNPPPSSVFEPFYSQKLIERLGAPRRRGEDLTARHRSIARGTQAALEASAVSLVEYIQRKTGETNLCLAGGVALNCSANNVIAKLPAVKRLYVQPAASDRGLALGCALHVAACNGEHIEPIEHVFYGPEISFDSIRSAIALTGFDAVECSDPSAEAAELIADGRIVGWFQGRSEFGPRALGHRSILADPRIPIMKNEINTRVKFREEFRPFAPSVVEERADQFFDMHDGPSPYMTVAVDVREGCGEKLPAITHVNNTARVQTVSAHVDPLYHRLITKLGEKTGIPVVLNTSFNIKGQPIVESPLDALATFAGTGLDAVFLGPFMVRKPKNPRAGR
jgi:carbamoyltransferase